MDVEEEVNSGSSDEEVEKTSKVLEHQRHVFEQMTELLKAQQETLKCNLQALQSKVTKLGPSKKEKGAADEFRNSSEEKLARLDTSSSSSTSGKNEKSEKIQYEDGGRQWSQSGSGRNYDTQICPICAAEFDDPENSDALEEHVAGHWCSSESN